MKSIIPFLMASVVLLAGSNTHILFGHNFSPVESASFLALVDTIMAEAQLVQQNIASNNMSLAISHANKALSLVTDDVNKEIAERNQRLSDDLNADLASLRTSAESADNGNNTTNNIDILVDDINGILDEIVTSRIALEQINNSTIHVLAAVELLDEVLNSYGDAFAVGYDMTNMSMMTMDGDNDSTTSNGGNDTANMHSMSTMNMGGDDMSMGDMSNTNEKLVNITDYQTAQALAMKVQELFDSQIITNSLSEGSENIDQSINSASIALKELVTSINAKSSPMDIMTIVHTKVHPNLMAAFGLQTVSLSDLDGNAPTNINTLFLIFSNKQEELGPITTELAKAGEGQYSGSGSYVSQPGNWEAKITVQRTDAYDLNHNFIFDIQNPP